MLKPLSVQLYSLREEAKKDFGAVLEKVAKIGYIGVEPAGFWDMTPQEFRKRTEDLGLKIFSSHSPWARPNTIDEGMEIANILGLKKIVCGYGADDFKDLDSIKRTAETTNLMKEKLNKNGFSLFQHNHDFEFERLDGKLKYEIYKEMVPGIKFQLDCFWSTNLGKENAVEMLKHFADDTISIHMKDGNLDQKVTGKKMVNGLLERKVELLPLGSGDLQIKELIEIVPDVVDTVIVELDFCNIDMFEAIEKSYNFMIENKLALGNK